MDATIINAPDHRLEFLLQLRNFLQVANVNLDIETWAKVDQAIEARVLKLLEE